jgi:pyruvate formate lyase activating enzyme
MLRAFGHDIKGHVHSYESMGAVDGPGLRFVVFLQGCPLRCQYCHNPDCRDPTKGRLLSVSEVMAEIVHHLPFLKAGGVTLSGGEPLLQHHFAASLLAACQAHGLHTALDTSGFCTLDHAAAALDHTDLVLLDIKSFDPNRYADLTHVDLATTLHFAEELRRRHKPFWLRYVLVPGLTDDLRSIEELSQYLADFPSLERIDVLPFHKMGEQKWEALGYPYQLKDTLPPDEGLVREVMAIFKKAGRPVYS